MAEPRWLADEMVGRLARYLRFLGYDAEYARGATDDEILERLRSDRRILLTRDRELARRVPDAVHLVSPHIREQLQALRLAFPGLHLEVRFERCSLCNGTLKPWNRSPLGAAPDDVPPGVLAGGIPIFRCERCGHPFWEGTHTRDVRQRLLEWLPAESRAP